MSTLSLQLDKHEQVLSPRHHFKVVTTGNVSISSSFLAQSVSFSSPSLPRPWLDFGTSFQIQFSFYFHDGIAIGGKGKGGWEQLVERLGVVLRDAEMWEQLMLVPSLSIPTGSPECRTDGGSIVRFELTFTRKHVSEAAGQGCTAVQNADPPAGVPSAVLKVVQLSLRISNDPDSAALGVCPLKRKREEREINTNDETGDSNGDIEDVEAECLVSTAVESQALIFEEDMSKDSQIGVGIKTTRLNEPARQKPRIISFKEVVRLMDCSLKGMINPPKQTIIMNQPLSSASPTPKTLSQLSPVIFIPSHREAISQRRPLLSTIAQTIANIACRTNSTSLREKLSRIRGDSGLELGLEGGRSKTHGRSMFDAAETKLWLLLTRRVYDPKACKKLRGLRVGSEGVAVLDKGEDMLDDPIPPLVSKENVAEAGDGAEGLGRSEGLVLVGGGLGNQTDEHDDDLFDDNDDAVPRLNKEDIAETVDHGEVRSSPSILLPEESCSQTQEGADGLFDDDKLEHLACEEEWPLMARQECLVGAYNSRGGDKDDELFWSDFEESPIGTCDRERRGEDDGDLLWSDFEDEEDLLADIDDRFVGSQHSIGLIEVDDEILEDAGPSWLMSTDSDCESSCSLLFDETAHDQTAIGESEMLLEI